MINLETMLKHVYSLVRQAAATREAAENNDSDEAPEPRIRREPTVKRVTSVNGETVVTIEPKVNRERERETSNRERERETSSASDSASIIENALNRHCSSGGGTLIDGSEIFLALIKQNQEMRNTIIQERMLFRRLIELVEAARRDPNSGFKFEE
jgi:hypothetical protein